MLKYFRVAEICILVQADGQESVEERLLQPAQTAECQGAQVVCLLGESDVSFSGFPLYCAG